MSRIRVGIIGCGNIAPRYVGGCRQFPVLDLVACADIDQARAEAFAQSHELEARAVETLLASPDIDLVINLTVPKAHAAVSLSIIRAGKHVYSEKPLATHREEGKAVLDAAREAGVLLGCAPDTFLGGGIQTCRKLIDDGQIGEPVAATAFFGVPGHESWHPNPAFYYEVGGGPMLDMGPYYLTALATLLGPVARVVGLAKQPRAERIITSQPRYGERIPVEVPTHLTALLDFENGVAGTITTSFDVPAHHQPRIEIYGSKGSLSVPDPNTFRGPVSMWLAAEREWKQIPLEFSDRVERGIGVADMAYAILSGRPHRASGDLAYHVLEVMQAVGESSALGRYVDIESRCERPAMLPPGLPDGQLDA